VRFKLSLCHPCAAKLRAILEERGEDAMAKAIGSTLCRSCLQRVPGFRPGDRLTVQPKRNAKPAGSA